MSADGFYKYLHHVIILINTIWVKDVWIHVLIISKSFKIYTSYELDWTSTYQLASEILKFLKILI